MNRKKKTSPAPSVQEKGDIQRVLYLYRLGGADSFVENGSLPAFLGSVRLRKATVLCTSFVHHDITTTGLLYDNAADIAQV